MEDLDWRERANCKGKTHLFFPAHAERPAARARREAEALALCAACPVQTPCGASARQNDGEYGLWAGKPTDYFASV